MNDAEIRRFDDYANSTEIRALMNLSTILLSINEDNYDEKFSEYKKAVESLNDSDLNLLKEFLGI